MAEAAGTDGATVDTIYPITGKKIQIHGETLSSGKTTLQIANYMVV